MEILDNPHKNLWDSICQRPSLNSSNLDDVIANVFKKVKKDRDKALIDFTSQYDKVNLESLLVEEPTLTSLSKTVEPSLQRAIIKAQENIHKFHESQKAGIKKIETTEGVTCWQENRPIQKVGIYIPGGTAPLFSTVLMLAIPAAIAGCIEVVLCTPPDQSGNIHPAIAFAAQLTGVTKVFAIGGAQAIAAMSIGTESVPKVQKIFGPGNQYVTAAKMFAFRQGTAIDMPAGPSELLVIASENSIPKFVASDLLSQAEHGVDSQVICLANSREKLQQIEQAIQKQIALLPRKEIAAKAIQNSKLICFDSVDECIAFSNIYAPEHLIIADKNYASYVSEIVNAGSVFLGNYCPESAGDYASGTNHTLPTAGFAKAFSGVNLDSFMKKITFQHITSEGIQNIGETVEIMAAAEGLEAHKNAITLRLLEIKRSDAGNS